jgi:UDP-glucose 4-epimerase
LKEKIVVTGGAGFISSHLCDALLGRAYKVTAVDNLSMGKMENIRHNLSNPGFSFEKLDVRDIKPLEKACAGARVIVHLAAYKIPRYGDAISTLLINSKGAMNVFEIAKKIHCKVVIASTSDVYGKSSNLPFKESGDLVIGPSDIPRWSYAISKLFDEHLAYSYHRACDIAITILRFFGCYGPRQHLSWWGGPQSVFISAILKDEEVEIHGDGSQKRCFIYIDDLIEGTVAAIESDKTNGEILNIGTTEEVSILELARLIKKLSGTPGEIKLQFVPYSSFSKDKYEDVMRRIPDLTKAQKILGFNPKIQLADGLKKTLDWQRKAIEANMR